MIREVSIQNFKSIQELELPLGRVNVLIGENGCGKSNILEGIALTAAAAQDKTDNEFLASRGIRMTEQRFIRAAFNPEQRTQDIALSLKIEGGLDCEYRLKSDDTMTHSRWHLPDPMRANIDAMIAPLARNMTDQPRDVRDLELVRSVVERMVVATEGLLPEFLIYSPENSSLRIFEAEGQILPLGIKGEGLFAHLKALNNEKNSPRLDEIADRLALIDWFERFEVPADLSPGERTLRIRDRYLAEGALFDQRSANEGFLFLLFYFTLFISPATPAFFAVDNIDASLNPKLCGELMRQLVELSEKYSKQVIFTTHNPAVLDGLNLHDDEQRLLVASRDIDGHTQVRRIGAPKPVDGEPPVRLSEAFMRGYIGGLPKNF